MTEKPVENLQITTFPLPHEHHSHTLRAAHFPTRQTAAPELDSTDLQILRLLRKNARMPFLEIARELKVSGATVHERVRNLEKGGFIEGFTANINYKKLGYSVTAIINVTLEHPSLDLKKLRDGLLSIPEITDAHNLTGDTDLLLTIKAKDIDHLRALLTNRVQHLPGVRRLSTAIILDSPVPPRGAPV